MGAQLRVLVMGVSGSGKSTVGEALADHLALDYLDADALHPITNVDKMAAGVPLTDDDRWPWLTKVGEALAASDGLIVACSALKRAYRDAIRAAAPDTSFVHLTGARDLLQSRLSRRENHFMPPALLDSQLETLEPLGADERGVTLDVAATVDELAAQAAAALVR